MNTSIAIDLSLNEAQRAKLAEIAEMPPDQSTRAIGGLAQAACEDLAAGGMMLSPASVNRLRSSLADVYDEDALVAAIEKGARKSGESVVVQYAIDPIYLTPLQDVASSNGMTLEDLVQNCLGSAFELGWFYEMNLDSRSIVLTVEQYNAIRSKIGREQIFGKDVADFVVGAAEARIAEDTLVASGRALAEVGHVEPTLKALSDITRANAEDGEQPEDDPAYEPEDEEASLFAGVV